MVKNSHKYADVIKAWADGETIQCKERFWSDFTQDKTPDFNSPELEWRIKPARYSGKFRVAFYRGVSGFSDYNLYIVHEHFVRDAEHDELFVQWLTHWIEYSVEIPNQK